MRVLLIKNNVVENAILADSVERAQQFYPDHLVMEQPDGVGPGFIFDPSINEFSPPEPVVVPEDRRITRLAFLNRFTDEEAIAIDLASQGATVQAAYMRRYQARVQAATFIDLDDPDTRNGVIALEDGGLLADGRADEILNAPVQPHEKPTGGV